MVLKVIFIFLVSFNFNAHSSPIENEIKKIQQLTNHQSQTEQFLNLLDDKNLIASDRFMVLDALTSHNYSKGDLNTALLYATKSLIVAQQNKLFIETGKALKRVGVMHYFKADVDTAIDYYKTSLPYFDVINFPILRANVLNNIALAHTRNADLIDALEHFKLANSLYQKYGSPIDIVDVKHNMAGVYMRLGHATNAIEILNEVIEERELLNDINGVYMAYSDLVIALKSNEQFDDSIAIAHKVIRYYRDKKDDYNLSATLHNLSDVYMSIANPLTSKKYALEGSEYAKKAQHNEAYVGTLLTLSQAHIALGEIDQAFETIEKSNAFLKTVKNQKLSSMNSGIHSLLLMTKGEHANAFYMYQQHMDNIRKVYSADFNNHLIKLESNQLKQQLTNFKNKEEMNRLERESEGRHRNIVYISIAFFTLLVFLLYRKVMDRRITTNLEERINKRTIELNAANKKLLAFSYVDGLTQLKNRRCFDEDIKSLWDDKENLNNQFHILIADIDYFKLYNDSYGHVAGDKALTKVANALKANIRENDKAYRYGGEEFVILFSNCNAETAISASQRIITQIEGIEIPHAYSKFNVVTLSAGMCTFNLSEIRSVEDFLHQADRKLYKAKESGKNQLCWV